MRGSSSNQGLPQFRYLVKVSSVSFPYTTEMLTSSHKGIMSRTKTICLGGSDRQPDEAKEKVEHHQSH
jgi:hypothetical protein